MPIHLQPMTRREFLIRSTAAGAALLLGPRAFGADGAGESDPHRFALLSDTHVAGDRTAVNRGVNMSEHLAQAVKEITALGPKPAGVIVSGDCALDKGLVGDYRQFAGLVNPLGAAALPVHLALGNHDHRANVLAELKRHCPASSPVAGKCVSIVSAARANWFLLDSLEKVKATPGLLGKAQLAWLAKALDAHTDKPAIVVAHHDPQWPGKGASGRPRRISGLKDTEALFDVLASRRHVKAYVYGHTHRWGHTERDGLHLINVPATAYVFGKSHPSAWVIAQLQPKGISLELRCLDAKHKAHGQKVELAWRS